MHVIRLNELLHEINSLVRLSISRNVRVEIETGVPMAVEADGVQLQQLLMNLIINAAEAIGEDRPGLVTVRTALETVSKNGEGPASGEYCAIEVEDNGSGMDAETIAHIFEPFFTTKFTGRGLGLAAATGIVHGHHGSLPVRSTPGAGSVFRVLLPGVPVQAPFEPAEIPVPVALTGHGTVLIIDDEEPVRKAVKNTLEFHGFAVLQADNGLRGVEMYTAHANEVSVILLDVTMPVMNGLEALRRIRQLRPNARIILSSGFNEAEMMKKFRGVELPGFLQKPYTSAQLAGKVAAALNA